MAVCFTQKMISMAMVRGIYAPTAPDNRFWRPSNGWYTGFTLESE
jgi:hypothetical protein